MLRTTRLTTRSITLHCFGSQRVSEKQRTRSSSASRLGEEWIDEALFGVAPVFYALKARRRKIYKLCIQEGIDISKRKDRSLINRGISDAKTRKVEIRYCPKHDMNMIVKGQVHQVCVANHDELMTCEQGFLLDCSPLELEEMEEFEHLENTAAPYPVWLALDEVFDPHNLGAMIRTAAFLGVDGILVSKKNSAPLSPVVSKVSSGAMEFAQIHGCQQLPKVLTKAGQSGWTVVGADVPKTAVNYLDFQIKGPTILVMGNEASGLRYAAKQACSSFIQIMPVKKVHEMVGLDSLNVSVAAGVLLSHLTKARMGV